MTESIIGQCPKCGGNLATCLNGVCPEDVKANVGTFTEDTNPDGTTDDAEPENTCEYETLARIRFAKESLEREFPKEDSVSGGYIRERSLALTKLDEARQWARDMISIKHNCPVE